MPKETISHNSDGDPSQMEKSSILNESQQQREDLKKQVEKGAEKARQKHRQEIVKNFVNHFGAVELEQLWDVGLLDTPENVKLLTNVASRIKNATDLSAFLDFFDEISEVDGVNAQIIIHRVKDVFKDNPKEINQFLSLITERAKKGNNSLYNILLGVINDEGKTGFRFNEVMPNQ